MKNWLTIVEDGDSTITAHYPMTRVKMVVQAKGLFVIHLDQGSIHVNGVGVEKLVTKLVATGQPTLKSGVAGIASVKFNRKS